MGLFHLLKRERPSSSHRFGVIGMHFTTPVQQVLAAGAVEVEIALQATSCLLDICACLIKSKRESIQGFDNLLRQRPLSYLVKWLIRHEQLGTTQQEEHS